MNLVCGQCGSTIRVPNYLKSVDICPHCGGRPLAYPQSTADNTGQSTALSPPAFLETFSQTFQPGLKVPQHDELGTILHHYQRWYVCEKGIFREKVEGRLNRFLESRGGNSPGGIRIFYDDIEALYHGVTKVITNGIITHTTMQIEIDSGYGKMMFLELRATSFFGEEFRGIYNAILNQIVSSIFERQWNKLVHTLSQGKSVDFAFFTIAPDAVHFFGSVPPIELGRIKNSSIYEGKVYVNYLANNGKVKSQCLGNTRAIPNVHLITTFLNEIGRQNQ